MEVCFLDFDAAVVVHGENRDPFFGFLILIVEFNRGDDLLRMFP